ncbi:hypothetical protein BCR41DRAFT_177478 [Lobosporangium transversale]|uniref:Uncharacterized protein n=1 Tax=Lobosporangium transversale TaxID=64571 RepID=A0A1Y2GX20_9FUNG|nr:hypothetical protein BCR41DRAFT_177478 [Lobosporangium transversale]ORZ26850.1 hypothetical protein BCR41DRAFT_177478 [Lobosporangium transversale]|eukprot:XP_021884597.1 hypothetical protein BCR41DRAFT_177478 [Lobosporangium transversale]
MLYLHLGGAGRNWPLSPPPPPQSFNPPPTLTLVVSQAKQLTSQSSLQLFPSGSSFSFSSSTPQQLHHILYFLITTFATITTFFCGSLYNFPTPYSTAYPSNMPAHVPTHPNVLHKYALFMLSYSAPVVTPPPPPSKLFRIVYHLPRYHFSFTVCMFYSSSLYLKV